MKAKELIKMLEQDGWEIDRIQGSHHIMIKEDKTVSIPVHNKDMGKGILNKLLKQTRLK